MQTFHKYMHDWLYGPKGYYTADRPIGKGGDFYTAVSTSRFFGATIAHYLIRLIDEGVLGTHATLIEIGAHRGYLLGDMAEWIAQERPALLASLRFGIVERFESLREAQRRHYAARFGNDVVVEIWDDLETVQNDEVFIVANEIFDAFPCDLLYKGKTALVDRSHEIHFEGEDADVLVIAERYGKTKGEVAKGYEAFALSLAKIAEKIVFITFDYGEKEPRTDFSLRIYSQHQVHPFFEEGLDRSVLFGCSDLTYDVDFRHLSDAFAAAGFVEHAYATQLRALTEFGLPDLLGQLAALGNQNLYLRELNKVKILIDPQMMGERFKMIEFRK